MTDGPKQTFASLDTASGIPPLDGPPTEGFALPEWYHSIRNIPLDELGTGDICRAIRQKIYLSHVVPIGLKMLEADPLAGEMFDGEIIASLKSVPPQYWLEHTDVTDLARKIVNMVLITCELDDEVRRDLSQIIKLLG